jgi:hypothetical protein
MGTYELKREVETVIEGRGMEKLERQSDEICV